MIRVSGLIIGYMYAYFSAENWFELIGRSYVNTGDIWRESGGRTDTTFEWTGPSATLSPPE